jgi:F0F1-type ATP synthase beta subunit
MSGLIKNELTIFFNPSAGIKPYHVQECAIWLVKNKKFSNFKGKLVSLKDSLDGCEQILNDKFDDYPESAFYMIVSIDEINDKKNES